MEPKSNYDGILWKDFTGDLLCNVESIDHVNRNDGDKQEDGPDKDDLEILNLLKGYLAKYLEQFFENPDDVVREALKARDEEIKRLENKIKKLEEKIDNLLLGIPTPTEGTPIPPDELPYKPYTSPWSPIDPIWYGGGIGITSGQQGTTSTSI
jgi:hypothetical protein